MGLINSKLKMYTGMLHTHKLVVMLFVIIYLIKTALLMFDKNELLKKFAAKTKVFEIIVSVLFLATGIYLAINTGNKGSWLWVKIAIVALSIPLAVIGFKKEKKPLALLAMMCLVYAYGISETKSPTFKIVTGNIKFESVPQADLGKSIYESKCIICHGADGKLALSGAKDLTQSQLTLEQKTELIKNGKNAMMPYKDQLTDEQVKAVAEYVTSMQVK